MNECMNEGNKDKGNGLKALFHDTGVGFVLRLHYTERFFFLLHPIPFYSPLSLLMDSLLCNDGQWFE